MRSVYFGLAHRWLTMSSWARTLSWSSLVGSGVLANEVDTLAVSSAGSEMTSKALRIGKPTITHCSQELS